MNGRITKGLVVCITTLAIAGLGVVPALAAPPANDDIDSATAITSILFNDSVTTTQATTADDDPTPSCGSQNSARSVWYSFTLGENTRLEANTQGSNYDTILSVWSGTRGALSEVACNDDAGALTSALFFDASAGETYYFMASSYGGRGGNLQFEVRTAPENLELDASVEDKGWVNAGTGRATITGEVVCSEPAMLSVELELVQQRPGNDRRGYGYLQVDCEGAERWLVSVPGEFEAGDAGIDATVYWNLDPSVRANSSLVLTLRSCTVIGTLDDDVMNGSDRNDKICSLAGDDVINGRGGNDQLRGHDGNDTATGGAGSDLLTGGFGTDDYEGGSGKDTLYGDAGPDRLHGGRGSDRCIGGAGADRLTSCEAKR